MLTTLEVSLWLREIPSWMQLSQIPHFQSRILCFQSCNWIICQSSHTLKTLETILHQNSSNSLPESPDASSIANTDFFEDKLEGIRTKFLPSDSPDPFLFPSAPQWSWSNHHESCQSVSFYRNFSIVIQASSYPASSKTISIHLSTDQSLSTDDLSHFCPISNLNFISKLLEKVVAFHIRSHLSSNSVFFSICSPDLSFYRNSETTLFYKIHNDLDLVM